MADYPGSIWAGNTRGTNLSDAETHTTWHDEAMAEIIAIQGELGVNPSGASFATVVARLNEFANASSVWTPVFTNMSFGNGTATGLYARLGPIIVAQFRGTMGPSGSSVTGSVTFTLPVARNGSAATSGILGTCDFLDTGTDTFPGIVTASGTGSGLLRAVETSTGTYADLDAISATIPMTWSGASGDELDINLSYIAL